MLEKLKSQATRLKKELTALYCAAQDARTPWYARLLIVAIVAYAVSPIDLIPDFIPIIGYLDDLVLLPLAIGLVLHLVPAAVMQDCRKKALSMTEPSRNWWAGAVIALLWVAGAILLAYWLMGRITEREQFDQLLGY